MTPLTSINVSTAETTLATVTGNFPGVLRIQINTEPGQGGQCGISVTFANGLVIDLDLGAEFGAMFYGDGAPDTHRIGYNELLELKQFRM